MTTNSRRRLTATTEYLAYVALWVAKVSSTRPDRQRRSRWTILILNVWFLISPYKAFLIFNNDVGTSNNCI